MVHYYIVRHGETEYNKRRLVQGAYDSRLTESGRTQAEQMGKKLRDVRFDLVVTGGQGRQIETANRILSQNEAARMVRFIPLSGFREQNYGIFDGKPESDYMRQVAEELSKTIGKPAAGIDPYKMIRNEEISMVEMSRIAARIDYTHQTETLEKLYDRSMASFGELEKKLTAENSNVLLVSSGNILSAFLYKLTGDERCAYRMHHGALTVLTQSEGTYKIEKWNEL